MMAKNSIVEYFAEHEAYKCGYCGNIDTNFSHGMWAHALTVQDYEDLIDRGWRRSGCYVYKPTMNQTCCPQYPIRCNVLDFKMSKSQKKVIKKVNKFLNTGIRPKESEQESELTDGSDTGKIGEGHVSADKSASVEAASDIKAFQQKPMPTQSGETESSTSTSLSSCVNGDVKLRPEADPESCDVKVDSSTAKCKTKILPRAGTGADPSRPTCKKAKLLRKEKLLKKLVERGESAEQQESRKPPAVGKTLEDLLGEVNENPTHKLEIKLVRNKSDDFEATLGESYSVYRKYQIAIHKDSPGECSRSSYERFLCDSPLEEEHSGCGFPDGLGSFHQHYLLDGKIIAVGVVDILPHCISSVYLYYDPDYDFLSLGTYSALREVAFTRQLHAMEPAISHYYMGFYIHSCPKMSYKGKYDPSFLNCPETHGWFPVAEAGIKLDNNKFSRFADDDAVDVNGVVELELVLVLHKRQHMPYIIYKRLNPDKNDENTVKEYSRFVGSACARRMLLYRS